MAATYRIYNGPMPTTASQAAVTTGTAIKTLLQVAPPTGSDLKVKGWGISFDASAAGVPGICELLETDVAATVTASVAADITRMNNPLGPAASALLVTLGTAATGYTATAEGTITAVRMGDAQQIAPTNQYIYQFPLGNEFTIQAGKFGRIRVKFAVAVNCIAWLEFEG
ncbi:MAG: hypothetical protein NVS2B16_25610 [Chloroflexota bacterium]